MLAVGRDETVGRAIGCVFVDSMLVVATGGCSARQRPMVSKMLSLMKFRRENSGSLTG